MLTTLLLCVPVLVGDPQVTWDAPTTYVQGLPFQVSIDIEVPEDGSPLAGWLFTPAAFTLNGKPVADRKGREVIHFAPGATLSMSFDLAPSIQTSKAFKGGDFELGFAKEYIDNEPIAVKVREAAPQGLSFLEMPVEELSKYRVLMSTNRGDMLMEFWPDVAPEHVRNYLELCYTGFYDGLIFHRVIPGFMIQGGDPTGTGRGSGPRTLKGEFSQDPKHKHVPGVLSMARTNDPNSATSQFFVVHKNAPNLDGKYTSFGKLVDGLDVVDRIVTTDRDRGDRPTEKQFIERAVVLLAD
jgi:peptidyl-prolyl cis-trans isomerase B (cyclophilin B)